MRFFFLAVSMAFIQMVVAADEPMLHAKPQYYESAEYVDPYVRLAAPATKCGGFFISAKPGVDLDNLYVQSFEYNYKKAPKNDSTWRGELRGSVALKEKPLFITKYGDANDTEGVEFRVYALRIDQKTRIISEVPADDVVRFGLIPPSYCADFTALGKRIGYAPLYMKSSRSLTWREKVLIAGGIIITLIIGGLAIWKGAKFTKEKLGAYNNSAATDEIAAGS